MNLWAFTSFFTSLFLSNFLHVYFYRKTPKYLLSDGDRKEWSSRILSTISSVIVGYGSVLYLMDASKMRFFINSILLCKGFLVYDIYSVIVNRNHYKTMTVLETLMHHTLVVLLPHSLFDSHGEIVAFGFLSEWSTPFLNNCWFMKKSGWGAGGWRKNIFNAIAVTTVFIFMLVRPINFLVQFLVLLVIGVSWQGYAIVLGILYLNVQWAHKLLVMLKKNIHQQQPQSAAPLS